MTNQTTSIINNEQVSQSDCEVLRQLAGRVREIAELPIIKERRELWYGVNACQAKRPMVLAYPDGCWDECLNESSCLCSNPLLRKWELTLRRKIYWFENINDDNVLNPWFDLPWELRLGNFGVEIKMQHGENRGSYVWEAPLQDIHRDLKKLSFRKVTVDKALTQQRLELANSIFGDLLPARYCLDVYWWSHGLTVDAVLLVGLEAFMMKMYDDPEGLHELMAFLRDDRMQYLDFLENEHLLVDDNESYFVGSGGVGCTRDLPQKDRKPGAPVRLIDRWGFSESQDTVGVSPEMFAEFVLPYQLPVLNRFGLKCYCCCEGIHARLKYIKDIPNLRRIAVSPWADQEYCAREMGSKFVFSRKQNPALICAQFAEAEIRRDLRNTLAIAGKCNLEIIMRDTHTVQNEPERITRWVKIARDEVNNYLDK